MAEKYFGKYRGKVTAVDNSDGMWKIKANVPKLLDGFTTGWALPCLGFAFDGAQAFFNISVGDMVWIEFEQGNIDYPIWTGGWFMKGQAPVTTGIMMNGTMVEWQDDGIVVHGNLVVNGAILCASLTASKDTDGGGNGTIEAEATIKASTDVKIGSLSVKDHVHSGVTTGSDKTGKAE